MRGPREYWPRFRMDGGTTATRRHGLSSGTELTNRATVRTSSWACFALSASLVAAFSCSMETPTAGPVEPPVEVVLDHSAPEVVELLEALLRKAQDRPKSASRRGDLGMAYEVNGFPDAALASYQQAEALVRTLDRNRARWPYFQALLLADRGQQQMALAALDRVIAIDAGYGPAWLWTGTWLIDVGKPALALDAFVQAESLGAGAAAIIGQARVALHQQRPGDAVALLEPLSREFKHPVVFQLLGRAYRESARIDDARIALARGRTLRQLRFEDAWHESKQRFEVSFIHRASRAQEMIHRGEPAKAIAILETLIEQQPDNRVIISNLATAYRRDGDPIRAVRLLRRAIETDPDYYPFRVGMADYYGERGDIDTALMHVDHALKLEPELAMLHSKRGLLLNQQDKPGAALKAFDTAIRYDPGNREAFMYAGQVEARLKRWPQAILRYEEAVRVDPSYTPGYLNLSAALAFAKRFEEARTALLQAQQLGTHAREVESALRRLAEMERRSG